MPTPNVSLTSSTERSKTVEFATENENKFREVKHILRGFGIEVRRLHVQKREIQSDSLEEIARCGVASIASTRKSPLMVEDTGLFIEALNGFPGSYSSYVHRTVGNEGILKLLETKRNRKAAFKSVVAFASGRKEARIFVGKARGRISTRQRGRGWGFDPIFEHENGGGLTYAEMGASGKNEISHRRKAIEKFALWYLGRSPADEATTSATHPAKSR